VSCLADSLISQIGLDFDRKGYFMKLANPTRLIASLVSVALIALGFMPAAHAGVVSTGDLLSAEARQTRISEVDALLQRADVREKLVHYGVSPESVAARVQGLSDSEITELHTAIDQQVAGGDALTVVGVGFLVFIILEIVGVTNVFSSI